jgi:hypothetical protein
MSSAGLGGIGAEQIDADQTLGPRQPARVPGIPAADTDGTARLQQSPGSQSWKSAQAGAVSYDLLNPWRPQNPRSGGWCRGNCPGPGRPLCSARRSDREARSRHRRHLARLAESTRRECRALPGGQKRPRANEWSRFGPRNSGVFAPRPSDVGGWSLPTLQQRRDGERQVPVALEQLGYL